MARRAPPLPTVAELEILRLLWTLGPSTVRELHEAHLEHKEVRYTTVLRLLQNMAAKGLVRRDDSARSHVYRAAVPAEQTEARLLKDLADRAFAGSTGRLVLRALTEHRATAEELAEIRNLLATLDPGGAERA